MPTSRWFVDAARLADAVLVDGEIVGTWRRARADVTVESWRRLSCAEREAVEAEASGLPLPGVASEIAARWVS